MQNKKTRELLMQVILLFFISRTIWEPDAENTT